MDQIELLDEMFIPMEDESGKEVNCEVLAIFPFEGKQYMVLLPEGKEENWMYRFIPAGEEEFQLEYIEDEEEFEAAMEVFLQLCEEDEIDEIMKE